MQIYEENKAVPGSDAIDLLKLADDMWKCFRKYWIRFLLLILALAALFTGVMIKQYTPKYQAYVTFAVSKNQTSAADSVVTRRLANSFQYILKNGRLERYIRNELGIVSSAEFGVSMGASAMEDTNLLTITAVAENSEKANKSIEAVIAYYPELSAQVVGTADFTVIDRSETGDVPGNSMNVFTTLAKGFLIGIMAVLGITFLMAYNNSTIGRYEDIKKYLSIPCLGTIPVTRFKKRKAKFDTSISIRNEKIPSAFKEAMNTLRTRVEKEMRDRQLKTILVSSSVPGEGKTTISLNLALSLQSRDKSVLLIDGDLRHPSIGELLGLTDVKIGVADVLGGKAKVSEALITSSELGIDLLPGRKKEVHNVSELLSSRRMQYLLEEVADYYDYVIVDTPPAAMMADASVVATYMDAMLYIIRQDFAKVEYISEGIGMLTDSDIVPLGCVLNCADPGLGRYGYGKYGYGKYGGGYGYYGGNE